MKVQIRKANKEAIPIVRELMMAYLNSLDFALDFQDIEVELDQLPGKYQEPAGVILLAYYEQKAVGVVALRAIDSEVCEMKRLYVLPDFTGNGIGEHLVDELLDFAKKAGYARMKLDTVARMKPAIRLYEKKGFLPTEPYIYNNQPDGLFFSKELT